MAYVPLTTVADNDTILTAWGNQVKDNFAAGVPDIFTTKGDLAIATAADAASRLGVGTDYQVVQARAGATLGVDYGSGVFSLCYKTTAQSINTGTLTKVAIGAVVQDALSMLDAVNNRLTIPAGIPTRQYLIMGFGYFDGHATVSKYRHAEIRVNGVPYIRQSAIQDDGTKAIGLSICGMRQLQVADYIELWVEQDSGGSLNFNEAFLALTMIR